MLPDLKFLIAESESPDARERRRRSTGRSSGETFAATLRELQPGSDVDLARPAEEGAPEWTPEALAEFDGIFLSGSPLHAWEDSPMVRQQQRFMRAAFASATPCFGSCAGLQVAVTAAEGSVRAKQGRHEAGLARRIVATEAGRAHPLLDGRSASWDALAIHSDEVERLPERAVLLASNASTTVQAAEIHWGPGVFWGVQYHPEMPPGEVADALRRQAKDLVKQHLARDDDDVESVASLLEGLDDGPVRDDLMWRLGTDEQVADRRQRTLELRNFIAYLVKPTQQTRRRS